MKTLTNFWLQPIENTSLWHMLWVMPSCWTILMVGWLILQSK